MAKLTFQDLSFEERKGFVRVWFLKIFYFDMAKERIGKFRTSDHSIDFPGLTEQEAKRRFQTIVDEGFKGLENSITAKRTIYVHTNSSIPLIGNVSFGIIDRNTTLVEVKPITGCNLDCMYCSVDEQKRSVDFIIEKDYLIQELKRLIDFKGTNGIEIHINSNGEPLYYAPLASLVSEISKWKEVATISIDTNATLLTKEKVDELLKQGLTRFNVSLNSLNKELAVRIAGKSYNLEHVKKICEYIADKGRLLIAPVLIAGVNDDEIAKIVDYAKSLRAMLGIQNFMNYRFGKNPVKGMKMEKFYDRLRALEQEYKAKLVLTERDFGIRKTRNLPKPFKKGDKIKAVIVCPGRMADEKIAVAKERNITVANCKKEGVIMIRITRDKHNIFYGVLVQ